MIDIFIHAENIKYCFNASKKLQKKKKHLKPIFPLLNKWVNYLARHY
jgi:hypothetical protein